MKRACLALAFALASACGDDAPPAGVDAGPNTDHCEFTAVPATARAGGTVTAGAVSAGAVEAILELPVGSALGAYTARANFLGVGTKPDIRKVEYSGKFNPSYGYEHAPRARAVALTAGDETVVILKADLGLSADGVTYDVTERLGPDFAGKVLFATSHSHSSWGHYSPNTGLGVGVGRLRRHTYDLLVDQLVALAQEALAARRPARVGIAVDPNFDPTDQVTHDRRGENNVLAGGPQKDHYLAVIRIDGADGAPIAILPVFGMHGVLLDADNPIATGDAIAGIERGLEESFDDPVVVMHLQGAAGDVSPGGSGGVECAGDGPCYVFAKIESVGRKAQPMILATWEQAEMDLKDSVAMEMLTRSIELGPDPETFTIRDGALRYARWDGVTPCDGEIYGPGGEVLSPIDEFNAPYGAALCGEENGAIFAAAQLPGTEELEGPYWSCNALPEAARVLGQLIGLDFEKLPVCAATRTTVSALRIGDYLFVTLPGEPLTLLADLMRAKSPVAPDKTVVVGYAQGHMGYLLTVEDWLLAGYEPSINFWGPLEGEYIAERAAEVMALAVTDEREDGAADGTDRFVTPQTDDSDVPPADPAPMKGQVPATVPVEVYYRDKPEDATGLTQAQPAAQVRRLESAYFVWLGEDALAGTPRVTLQREATPGAGDFADVVRRSGRKVQDGDLIVTWTPLPLRRTEGEQRTHYWTVEWQAVPVWGAVGLDDLEDRAGVPLGRYRFHVEGTGYTLDSDPFEVVAGAITVGATRTDTSITATMSYEPTAGWRLMDQGRPANRAIPVHRGPVTVRLSLSGGGTVEFVDVALAGDGQVTVDAGGDAANVASVEVIDRFGNSGSATL